MRKVRSKNGANRTSDIEGKAARVGASKPEAREFQLQRKNG
jgi:hypothetical protein